MSRRLGEQFRHLRENRCIALRTLAEKVGVHYFAIRRHEAGELMLRTDVLYRAARALRYPPARLLYIDQENI